MPILEKGSLEEDDVLQKRWARLLAQAATDPDTVTPAFASILAELSPTEARILTDWYHRNENLEGNGATVFEDTILSGYFEKYGLRNEAAWIVEDNFLRLRLFEPHTPVLGATAFRRALNNHLDTRYSPPIDEIHLDTQDGFRTTRLGFSFIRTVVDGPFAPNQHDK